MAVTLLAVILLASGCLPRDRPTPVARRVAARRIILGKPHAPTVG
jgi:hypothetical protein